MTHQYGVELAVNESGESITIQAPNAEAEGADGEVSVSVEEMTVACSSPAPVSARYALNANFELGDFRVMVSAGDPRLSFAPKVGHVAVFDGESYQVMSAHRVREFGATVAYDLLLRGSA